MYRNKRNNDVKEAAIKADAKLSIRLRKEFTQDEKGQIFHIIKRIDAARGRS